MPSEPYTCLNGQILPARRAAVAVGDRGFRFGDGVFETIRLHRGMPYQWDRHLTRLHEGLAALRIMPPAVDWDYHAARLITRNKAKEGFLRIAISRGSGSRGYLPFPEQMPPTWVIEYLPPLAEPEAPFQLWLSNIARIPPQCLPVQMKLAQGVNNTLALFDARDHGCDEALQLTTNGLLCETASANIFWLKDKTLFTPSLETGCLQGTTREAVMRLSPLPIRSVQEGIAALADAEAAFITNCRLGVWPVASILPMGWVYDATHPFLRKLSQLLTRDRAQDIAATKQSWKKAA